MLVLHTAEVKQTATDVRISVFFFFFGHPGMEGTALDMFYRSIHQSKEESIDAIVDVDAAAAVGGAAAVVCNVML